MRNKRLTTFYPRVTAILILLAFTLNSGFVPAHYANAQRPVMPASLVNLSPTIAPPLLKGLKIHPDNPFRIDFILDKGDVLLSDAELKIESTRLIKYFLAAVTVPEDDLWVNLSPFEKDRIIPEALGVTEMGRDLLAQDYLLKQITAALLYPEGETGKVFWEKVYAEAERRYGTINIPVETFNKVWIVPEKAVVFENEQGAYIVESRLRVMLESDYVASEQEHESSGARDHPVEPAHMRLGAPEDSSLELAKSVLREVVIPVLEQEVNEGANFAQLRQVYHSLILAAWFKDKVKASSFGGVYVDKNKTGGVDIADKNEKEKIWERYVESFKQGAYNYIKEDYDPVAEETIVRKYFAGGFAFRRAGDAAQMINDPVQLPPAGAGNAIVLPTDMVMAGEASDAVEASYQDLQDFLANYKVVSEDTDDDRFSVSVGRIVQHEIPAAVETLEEIVALRQWMDAHGAVDRPLVLWQNLRLGEMYPFFGGNESVLRQALGIIEVRSPQVTAWARPGVMPPPEITGARYLLVKFSSPSHLGKRRPEHKEFETALENFASKSRAAVLMIDHSGRDQLSNAQSKVDQRIYDEVEADFTRKMYPPADDQTVNREVRHREILLYEQDPFTGKEGVLGMSMFWAFVNPGNGREVSWMDDISAFFDLGPSPEVLIAGSRRRVSDVVREFYYKSILMAVRDGESLILKDVRTRIKEMAPEGSVVKTTPISGLDQEGHPGGIDLTRDRLNVEIQGHGNGIQFNFDPAMIQQLRNATGLTPVIINMHPMLTTVPVFFGVKPDQSSTSLAPVL